MSFLVRLPKELYPTDALIGFTQAAFDIASARSGIWLSQLAYESDESKQKCILEKWGLRQVSYLDCQVSSILPVAHTRGFIAEGQGSLQNVLFISFAGTDPLMAANWATDFTFMTSADGIYQGFEAAVDAVWSEIKQILMRAGSATVVVSGHSLGGALAILCAQRVEAQKCATVAAVYTYGQPRVADDKFARTFNPVLGKRTYRLVYGDDIVPTVPPSELGFRHVGKLLKCERGGKFDPALLAPDTAGDLPTFAPTLIEGLRAGVVQLVGNEPPETRFDWLGKAFRFLPPPVRDHLPDQYWSAL